MGTHKGQEIVAQANSRHDRAREKSAPREGSPDRENPFVRAELAVGNDFGSRPGDYHLREAFQRYARIGVVGMIPYECIRETAREIARSLADEFAEADEALAKKSQGLARGTDRGELLAWVDSVIAKA